MTVKRRVVFAATRPENALGALVTLANDIVDVLQASGMGPGLARVSDVEGRDVYGRVVADAPTSGTVGSVTIDQALALLSAGTTFALTATVLDFLGQPASVPVTWVSGNPAVATVDETTGVVTAIAPGTASIVASAGGVNSSPRNVTVQATDYSAKSVVMTPTSVVLTMAPSGALAATVSPSTLELTAP
jgi:hypothetical protein